MKIKNTIHQNPLYVGDLVAKYKAKGLIRVAPEMSQKQVEAFKMALKDQKRALKMRSAK